MAKNSGGTRKSAAFKKFEQAIKNAKTPAQLRALRVQLARFSR
jgi:hypothetical protein